MPLKRRIVRRVRRTRPKLSAKKTSSRRRLQPAAAAAVVGYVGYKAYQNRKAYKVAAAKANRYRQKANLESSKNIVSLSAAGLTVGSKKVKSLKEKINEVEENPLYFRQTHAYKINGDSGRMNWFYSASLTGGTLINMINKLKDSKSDANTANTTITDPTVAVGSNGVPQQFYKYLVEYNSIGYQIMNSSTNTMQGTIMWIKPKRELYSTFPSTSIPIRPCNIFAMALNSAIPTQNVYNPTSYTQSAATGGFITSTLALDYNRGGNTGTTNNTGDVVLEIDIGIKPSSACVSNIFDYYFDVVKSTDFDLSPGQQGDFYLKQHDLNVLDFQALQYDSIPSTTMYCMIGFKGQLVGTNATTGDINLVSTGSAQISVIETHKTIIRAHQYSAPKVWNFINDAGESAPAGILAQMADANQEIINDETDGVDGTYNEVA